MCCVLLSVVIIGVFVWVVKRYLMNTKRAVLGVFVEIYPNEIII